MCPTKRDWAVPGTQFAVRGFPSRTYGHVNPSAAALTTLRAMYPLISRAQTMTPRRGSHACPRSSPSCRPPLHLACDTGVPCPEHSLPLWASVTVLSPPLSPKGMRPRFAMPSTHRQKCTTCSTRLIPSYRVNERSNE